MAVVVGTNSWVTIAEADTYLTDHMDAEDWFTLADAGAPGARSKTTVLITAFLWLSGDPSLELLPSLTDDDVKDAQCEAALWLLNYYTALDARRAAASTGLTDMRLSQRSESIDISKITIPPHIMGKLASYAQMNTFVEIEGAYDA